MGEWVFSLTSMVTIHLVADGSVLVRLSLMYNPCSYVVDLAAEERGLPEALIGLVSAGREGRRT